LQIAAYGARQKFIAKINICLDCMYVYERALSGGCAHREEIVAKRLGFLVNQSKLSLYVRELRAQHQEKASARKVLILHQRAIPT